MPPPFPRRNAALTQTKPVPIVPAVQSLRSVPVVQIVRGTKKKERHSAIWEFPKGGRWSEAIEVGSLAFAEKVKRELGIRAMYREVDQAGGTYALREHSEAYGSEFASENEALGPKNTIPWQKFAKTAET